MFDFSSLSSLPSSLAVCSVLLLLLALLLARPWLIASWANAKIRRHIKRMHKQGAHVIDHIYLRNRKGDIVYIEHLIIGNEITCLNTCARTGNISGSFRSPTWSQESGQGHQRFENPLRQQDKMINTLQGIIGSRLNIQTITVFTHASLEISECENIIPLKQLNQRLPSTEAQKAKFNSQQLLQLIQNVSVDKSPEPSNQHGNPSLLKTANTLLVSSVTTMTMAIGLMLFNMA